LHDKNVRNFNVTLVCESAEHVDARTGLVLDRIFSDQCDTFEYDWNSIRVSTHSHSSRTRTRTHRPVAVPCKSAIIMCERT